VDISKLIEAIRNEKPERKINEAIQEDTGELLTDKIKALKKEAEEYYEGQGIVPIQDELYDDIAVELAYAVGITTTEAFNKVEKVLGPLDESAKKRLEEKYKVKPKFNMNRLVEAISDEMVYGGEFNKVKFLKETISFDTGIYDIVERPTSDNGNLFMIQKANEGVQALDPSDLREFIKKGIVRVSETKVNEENKEEVKNTEVPGTTLEKEKPIETVVETGEVPKIVKLDKPGNVLDDKPAVDLANNSPANEPREKEVKECILIIVAPKTEDKEELEDEYEFESPEEMEEFDNEIEESLKKIDESKSDKKVPEDKEYKVKGTKKKVKKGEKDKTIPWYIAYSMKKKGYKKSKKSKAKVKENINEALIGVGSRVEILDPGEIYSRDKAVATKFDLKNWEEGYVPEKGAQGIVDDDFTSDLGDRLFIVKLDNGKEVIVKWVAVKMVRKSSTSINKSSTVEQKLLNKNESITTLYNKFNLNEDRSIADIKEDILTLFTSCENGLLDAIGAADEAESIARKAGGEIDRVVGGQLQGYLIPHLKAWIDDKNQTGSLASLKNFLNSEEIGESKIEEGIFKHLNKKRVDAYVAMTPEALKEQLAFIMKKHGLGDMFKKIWEDLYTELKKENFIKGDIDRAFAGMEESKIIEANLGSANKILAIVEDEMREQNIIPSTNYLRELITDYYKDIIEDMIIEIANMLAVKGVEVKIGESKEINERGPDFKKYDMYGIDHKTNELIIYNKGKEVDRLDIVDMLDDFLNNLGYIKESKKELSNLLEKYDLIDEKKKDTEEESQKKEQNKKIQDEINKKQIEKDKKRSK
jgi:hypothetical protein